MKLFEIFNLNVKYQTRSRYLKFGSLGSIFSRTSTGLVISVDRKKHNALQFKVLLFKNCKMEIDKEI